MVNSNPDFVVVGEGRNFTLEMVNTAVAMIEEATGKKVFSRWKT
ncbi:MAG TPA: hypothetical protein VKN14_05060 [Flavobacteriaceae bacterium]|nr:hypothetical protein [Flavobacteriaceae bacterium]